MHRTDFSPNFQNRYMCGNDQPDLLFAIAQETLLLKPIFSREFREYLHIPPSFCALAFHNGWQGRNIIRALTPTMTPPLRPSMSDKNLNFGPETPDVCRRVCAGCAYHHHHHHHMCISNAPITNMDIGALQQS